MPIPLIQPLIDEKNKISQDQPWLIFLKLTSAKGNTVINLVRNTEDITFKGEVYTAFPFELTNIPELTKGSLPSCTLKVSNQDKQIQRAIEADETFGSGWNVNIILAHMSELNGTILPDKVAEIEQEWTSLDLHSTDEFVSINLGMPNPMLIQFPKQKYLGGFCQRTFNDGRGCTYSSQVFEESPLYPTEVRNISGDNHTFVDGTTINIKGSSFSTYLTNSYAYNFLGGDNGRRYWTSTGDKSSPVQVGEYLEFGYSRFIVMSSFEVMWSFSYIGDARDNIIRASPTRYKLQGYNENTSNWELIYQVDEPTGANDFFVTNNHTPYKKFRFLFDEMVFNENSFGDKKIVAIFFKVTKINNIPYDGYTTCNKTLANCKERFSQNRVNSKGEKIGIPFLGFNGIPVRAIYGT